MAGYVIHTPPSLSASDERRASELGPDNVTGGASPEDLARRVGFSNVVRSDVTSQFRATIEAMLDAETLWEPELRAEQGDEEYRAGRERGESMWTGIREGLLRRSLLTAVRS